MGKNAFLSTFFFLLIVVDVSDASLLSSFRKLVGAAPKDANATIIQKWGTRQTDGSENKGPKPLVPDKSTQVDPKGLSKDLSSSNNTSSDNNKGKNNGTDQNKKDEEKTDPSQTESTDNCDGSVAKRCNRDMTACIQSSQSGSKEVVVLVQNKGESTLKVNLSGESISKNLEIPKHQTKNITISLTNGKSYKLLLNAGNGDCELDVRPLVEANVYMRFPSFDKLLTPVNGAYLLILTVLVFGGTWACFKLRKRRHHGGVPYQELEMGLPESVSAINVETAEGWDQGWDDDWDEDNAVRSPGERHAGSISANGLTSRSSNRDGWEDDWND
ncbi:uncharacterized protein LOC121268044 isoform X2 [Juglans microcarpa x Juglans regia]|uniref:uncharacterized protein LOC121268044 isoform X2 n=1 Tax=Juglans microcarpa x Juglans regia TaxID=2249226 RepID=UPI001B7DB75A|nr:uncharacterized protein LOC121268044 isoform X2 [Juglans microcarpa x Juglans regia]